MEDKQDGSFPVRRFLETSKTLSLELHRDEFGSDPLNKFCANVRFCSEGRENMNLGIDPTNLLEERSRL